MSLCIRCATWVEPAEKRLHLLRSHPADAAASGYAWTPADLSDPLVAAMIQVLPGPPTESCWMWTGTINPNGYGHFVRRKDGKQRSHYPHRAVYADLVGEIPPGHQVHHACHNRWCCSPYHIHAVPPQANLLDRASTKGTAICL